jgi:hypothetical protein
MSLFLKVFLVPALFFFISCARHPKGSVAVVESGSPCPGPISSPPDSVKHASAPSGASFWIPPEFVEQSKVVDEGGCAPEKIPGFQFRRLQRCIDSLVLADQAESAAVLIGLQVQPGNSFAEIGRRTVQLAKILKSQGKNKEASALVEAFLVYKPAALEWLDSASVFEASMRQDLEDRSRELAPLVKQISNHMAIRSDYALVKMLTDSLRSLALSDSQRSWASRQDSVAFSRSLARSQVLQDSVRKLVLDRAAFEQAKSLLKGMRSLHPDLLAKVPLDSLDAWVEGLVQQEGSDQNTAWWKGRDPAKVIADARRLRDAGKLLDAIILYRHLLFSPLRKDARLELDAVGEAYCGILRKRAADHYSAAKASKISKDAGARLAQAVAALDDCLEQFPDSPQRTKVKQNRDLLSQELGKLRQ